MMKKMIALSGLLLACIGNIKAMQPRDVTVHISHDHLKEIIKFCDLDLSTASQLAHCLDKGQGYHGPVSQLLQMLPLTLFMKALRQKGVLYSHTNELLGAKLHARWVLFKLLEKNNPDTVQRKASKYVNHIYDTEAA